jgi:hypothetical protein
MLETVSPVTRAELVGDADAPTEGDVVEWQSPDFPTDATVSEPRSFSSTPDVSNSLSAAASSGLPTTSDLSIMGIGTGGGDFSQYGLDVGGGGVDFFGLGRTARGVQRIVYVVDKSGSMVETFTFVRQELRRSISELRRSQKFHVIFFSSGDPLENPPRRLVSAITAQKEQFFSFLMNVTPGGSTDPEPAMGKALSLEPDVVYFLTDGEFNPSLLARLNEWNKDRRTRIFTIAFFGSDGAALLERIAREHGGEYKFVSEYDVP